MPQLTWFITGCSSGFGEHLIRIALNRGDNVIGTTRGPPARLSTLQEAGATTMSLDVCASREALDTTISEALKVYDGIDVLVNNAGYIEAGLWRTSRVAECLKKETEAFGIRTLIFEPAYYRTKVFSPTNFKLQPLRPGLEAYQEIHDGLAEGTKAYDGNQPWDPEKGMKLIVDVVRREGCAEGKEVPIRLPLGKVGVEQLRDKCLATLKMLEEWEEEIARHDE